MQKPSFLKMLKNVLFPHFHFLSVSTLLILTHIVLFTLCLAYSGTLKNDPSFLSIPQKSLYTFGQNYPYFIITEHEYWRLFNNSLLASDFWHLMTIFTTLLILGSFLEAKFGHFKYFLLFMFSAIVGTMETAILMDTPSVGGSFFSMAVIGSIYSFAFEEMNAVDEMIKINKLKENVPYPGKYAREFQYMVTGIWAMDLVIGVKNQNIDIFGNAMSVMNGALFCWAMANGYWKKWELFKKMSLGILSSGLFIGLLFRNPELMSP